MIFRKLEFTNNQYEVSDTGVVKSMKYGKEKILILHDSIHGYLSCVLFYSKKPKNFSVHQLVAIAFLGHIPNGLNIVVDHIDSNKTNNNVSNLRLITHVENITRWRPDKKSKHLGVYLQKEGGRWISRIKISNKIIHLGLYDSDTEALEMFKKASLNTHHYKGCNESFRKLLNKLP